MAERIGATIAEVKASLAVLKSQPKPVDDVIERVAQGPTAES
jgi:hypothetical protein